MLADLSVDGRSVGERKAGMLPYATLAEVSSPSSWPISSSGREGVGERNQAVERTSSLAQGAGVASASFQSGVEGQDLDIVGQ